MRYILIIGFSLGLAISSRGQSPPGAIIKRDKKLDKNCIYRAKYSRAERMKIFPFDVSDTVKLVSFRYHRNNYPVRTNAVLTDSLIEQVILTRSQVNQFTDVLYNNVTKNNGNPNTLHIGAIN